MTNEERFFSKVKKTRKCWEWTASTVGFGYGTFIANGKRWQSHRWSFARFVGPIAKGLFVCHKCDNPACVRPEHLFLGTHTDNMLDASRKGRLSGPKMGLRKPYCKRGHFVEDFLIHYGHGRRSCGLCVQIRSRRYAKERSERKRLERLKPQAKETV